MLLHAGAMPAGLLSTVPPVVWEAVCLSSETASPDADVASEDSREVSLPLPPSPSPLAWQWLRAPELDTSSDILSSVDMVMGPWRGGQSDSWRSKRGMEGTRSDLGFVEGSKCYRTSVEFRCTVKPVRSATST